MCCADAGLLPLSVLCAVGGNVIDQDWNDDTEYHRAEGRAWVMVAVASFCVLVVVGLVVLAVSGVGIFVALVNTLSG
ncbi:hypothetical protein AMK10_00535 [Streptomyces sp. CB02058]|nr:hypothetical protein AMK10_00535 [Streptomyces sp. CB02058]